MARAQVGREEQMIESHRQRRMVLGAVMAIAVAAAIDAPAARAQDRKRIRITTGDKVVYANLNDSKAARDLAAMLPLSIAMDDHLRREKTGVIPKPLSDRAPGSRTYDRGDLGYWRPRNAFVIFYRQDGLDIPGPGIVLLGKVDGGVEAFDLPGSVKVQVDLVK
jgi:hypothetical protein